MIEIKNKISKLFSVFILFVYCISLSPSLIPHNHTDTDCTNHSHAYCESDLGSTNTNNHCDHNQHLDKFEKNCFLCDNTAVNDYVHINHFIISKIELFLNLDKKLDFRLNFNRFICLLNKSPPTIS